jgi:glyoxylase-like metal-dependent hydrolase (beta-lactamase superfamily II)
MKYAAALKLRATRGWEDRFMPNREAHTGISESMVTPMEHVATGVEGLRIAFVNVFGIAHASGDWTLIDAGLPFSASFIRSWGERRFGGPAKSIVLTHGHFDHVSAAADLADEWNAPIYAHPLEFPYLTGKREYPPPDVTAGGGLMTILSPMYPRGPVDLSKWLLPIETGPGAETLSPVPGWEVIHSPGHTPGHISLFRAFDLALLVGDAFCTTKPESFFEAALAQAPELHGPPAYFTADPQQASRSILMLANLHPRIIAPGHGRPLAGVPVEQKLAQFAALFSSENGMEKAGGNPGPEIAAA